jgi:hypothetical protein
MTTDQFEMDLQAALARCAAEIPAAVGARLRDHRYHRRRLSAPVVGLAVAVVAVGTGTAVVAVTHGSTPAPAQQVASGGNPSPSSGSDNGGPRARLTTVTLKLPAALRTVDSVCGTAGNTTAPSIDYFGHSLGSTPGTGCLQVLVSHGALPMGVTPVRVGDDVVGLTTDPAADQATLYVDPADPASAAGADVHDVVELAVTAEGLSVSAVAPGAVTAPPTTPLTPCPGDCG